MKLLAIFVIAFALANANVIQHPNPEETPGLFEGDIAGITWDSAKGAYQIPSLARGLWPSGVVPYVLDTSAGYSQTEKKAILAGMQLLEDSTRQNGRNCVTFVPRTTESTYIRVIRGNGCYSYAGKQIMSGAQDLSIGTGCADPIIVAHEFIHALGWLHEQSRPDRDLYVTVYYENIQKGMEGNFQKMTTSQVGQMDIPYDYDSVMHYPETAFSTNGKKTMVPKKVGANIGQRSFVSQLDIREIRDAYKCT